MIWLTWRQFRTQATVLLAAVAALAAVLAATGPRLAQLYDTAGRDLLSRISGADQSLYYVGWAVVLAVPALVGLFWGAPLIARELEDGTHRLVWNQSVTRARWLATKLVFAGLATMIVAGLASLAVTWWSGPVDRAVGLGGSDASDPFFPRIDPLVFGARGVVPIGYAAFAFILGVTLGVLFRRTLPAMAVTLAVFAALQVAMPLVVRPHLATPVQVTLPFTQVEPTNIGVDAVREVDFGQPGAWILSQHTVDASGHRAGLPPSFTGCESFSDCVAVLVGSGYRQQVTYQPAANFWPLQWAETGVYLGLTVFLAAFCAWWIRGRLT
ncbi:ABC transporter permease subunit [Streptomyces sp. SID13726]|uniref:ABC transporter permease subunit n=1 Tax=Streptomyces sp. SID13726 TaxID=2706058 RepID=UPI0013BB64B8|nr:ABC transporter permease subunit [Streptomyces sp. SID13726]NEB04962.1 ABC transporter permease subunit [Streptomyces sp. SID13726]